MKTLGKKIKAIRASKGLSQEDMAYDLDISLSTYGKIERDQTDLTIASLEGIGKLFKMSIIEILSYGSETPLISSDCKKLLEEKDKELRENEKVLREKDNEIIKLQKKLLKQISKK